MGIALVTLAHFFSPLEAFFTGFMPRGRALGRAPQRSCARPVASAAPRAEAEASTCRPAGRPLRVVRVSEPRMATQCAGRMVISGRMADVCAELDRLAALEAQAPRR